MLVNAGCNVNLKGDNGWAPLHSAAFSGYGDLIEALLKHGADVNITNNNLFTPLHFVSESTRCTGRNASKNLELLLYYGANIFAENNVRRHVSIASIYNCIRRQIIICICWR